MLIITLVTILVIIWFILFVFALDYFLDIFNKFKILMLFLFDLITDEVVIKYLNNLFLAMFAGCWFSYSIFGEVPCLIIYRVFITIMILVKDINLIGSFICRDYYTKNNGFLNNFYVHLTLYNIIYSIFFWLSFSKTPFL